MKEISSNTATKHIGCTCCGVVHNVDNSLLNYSLLCNHCHSTIYKNTPNSVRNVFFLSLTGLFIFFPTISEPLLEAHMATVENSVNIYNSVTSLFDRHPFVSFVSTFFVVVFPLLYFALTSLVSCFTMLKKYKFFRRKSLLILGLMKNWYMLDVFFISVFISLIKLFGDFEIFFGIGFYLLIFLGITVILTDYYLSLEHLWECLENED